MTRGVCIMMVGARVTRVEVLRSGETGSGEANSEESERYDLMGSPEK
jgi:hypothetical protein